MSNYHNIRFSGSCKYTEGTIIGNWTIVGRLFYLKATPYALCQCHCGTFFVHSLGNLLNSPSCGCIRKLAHIRRCVVCGNEFSVSGPAARQRSCSCHCGRLDVLRRQPPSHAKPRAEYQTWWNMIKRCADTNDRNYGGRGISVCDRWKNSFDDFFQDMGPRPGLNYSLDRIENNGNYNPDNCRWANSAVQRRNSRNTRPITFHGTTLLLTDWAYLMGVMPSTLHKALKTKSVEEVFSGLT